MSVSLFTETLSQFRLYADLYIQFPYSYITLPHTWTQIDLITIRTSRMMKNWIYTEYVHEYTTLSRSTSLKSIVCGATLDLCPVPPNFNS